MARDVAQLRLPAVLFMRNASRRRCGGTLSKPDSTTVSSVPALGRVVSVNVTSVGFSCSVVDRGIHRVRMPAIREQVLGLDPLDDDVEPDVLVARDA